MIQYYIDELIREGVTYLAPFENSHGRPRTKSAEAVSSADQIEEDGTDALPIASSAIEAADTLPLASRPGEEWTHVDANDMQGQVFFKWNT